MAKVGRGAGIPARFAKAESLSDIARNASTFGDAIRPLYAVKSGQSYMVMWPGASIDGSRVVLYSESKSVGSCLVYQPKSGAGGGRLEFTESQPAGPQTGNVQCIPIMELSRSPFVEKKGGPRHLNCIEVKDHMQLLRAVIAKAMEHETMGKVYAFKHRSERYICALGLIEEDEIKVLTYSKFSAGKDFCFFRYDYTSDRAEPTDVFGDHAYIYVRVINLAAPFPFFKPD